MFFFSLLWFTFSAITYAQRIGLAIHLVSHLILSARACTVPRRPNHALFLGRGNLANRSPSFPRSHSSRSRISPRRGRFPPLSQPLFQVLLAPHGIHLLEKSREGAAALDQKSQSFGVVPPQQNRVLHSQGAIDPNQLSDPGGQQGLALPQLFAKLLLKRGGNFLYDPDWIGGTPFRVHFGGGGCPAPFCSRFWRGFVADLQ